MRLQILFIALFLLPSLSQAQDCAEATVLSSQETMLTVPSLSRAAADTPHQISDCRAEGLPATHPAWVQFTAPVDARLAFDLIPLNEGDDLDFILYKVEGDDCQSRTAIRCTAAGPNIGGATAFSTPCMGATGLKANVDTNAAASGCDNADGNYLSPVFVKAGETYLLWVNNYALSSGNRPSGQADGFTLLLDFDQAALVSETDILSSLRVFPNPATDWLQLELQLPAATPMEVIVQNALGQQITTALYDGTAGKHTYPLPTEKWLPGLYWVTVVVDGVRRVVVVEKL